METFIKHFEKGQYQIHPPTPPPTKDMAQTANGGEMMEPLSWKYNFIPSGVLEYSGLKYSEPLPKYYKENHPWDIGIVSAPDCPDHTNVIRLIKTAPFNFAFRIESSTRFKQFKNF